MNKVSIIETMLAGRNVIPTQEVKQVFCAANIALCKYWGKRNSELNLPINSSLSISLNDRGSFMSIKVINAAADQIFLSNQLLEPDNAFAKRLSAYLDLFRGSESYFFQVKTETTVPIAAGLASSASGFAAVVKSLNQLFSWNLSLKEQSILARLGSGSASRSVAEGFMLWHKGEREDGMDSYAEQLTVTWPELRIGVVMLCEAKKKIGSTEAMQRTLTTSILYRSWPEQAAQDIEKLRHAIHDKDFQLLGETSEANALAMHACMLSAVPAILYSLPETLATMQKIWQLRAEGLAVYFTQDAGPNLKLLFLEKDLQEIVSCFPGIEIIKPF